MSDTPFTKLSAVVFAGEEIQDVCKRLIGEFLEYVSGDYPTGYTLSIQIELPNNDEFVSKYGLGINGVVSITHTASHYVVNQKWNEARNENG